MPIAKSTAPAPVPKDTEQLRKKRSDLFNEVENEVAVRLGLAPLKPGEALDEWKGRKCLHDLFLYYHMNHLGVRITDIRREIQKEIAKLVPN